VSERERELADAKICPSSVRTSTSKFAFIITPFAMLGRPARACCCGSFRQQNILVRQNLRSYVKAVDWALPGGSAYKKRWSSEDECKTCRASDNASSSDGLVPNFGVVAALSRNRVIGVEGGLPWSLREDRLHFEELTRDKVLIIGRKTLDEQEDGSHIQHVRKCIVVSTTLAELDSARCDTDKLSLARSFNDALMTAANVSNYHNTNESSIDCWVGGGERLYTEALNHPKCREVRLTHVDIDIDFKTGQNVALFPRKYVWDRFYALHERREGKHSGVGNVPKYEFVAYKRRAFL